MTMVSLLMVLSGTRPTPSGMPSVHWNLGIVVLARVLAYFHDGPLDGRHEMLREVRSQIVYPVYEPTPVQPPDDPMPLSSTFGLAVYRAVYRSDQAVDYYYASARSVPQPRD